ncbi:MAG TPA: hypothetical protein PLM16_00190 [Candidatus Woesebacteria bacterium]|nr:hypothetical protein [Candidatus Woesebacteria bacterium]
MSQPATDKPELLEVSEPIQINQPNEEPKLSSSESASHTSSSLDELALRYVDEYRQGVYYQQRAVISPIEVDELTSKIAKLYEKVRRIVDWKEENIIRRTAIERILKRTLLSEISGIGQGALDAEKITEPLVMEMVRSGYFSNGRVSRNKIPLAKASLAKYIYILNHSPFSTKEGSLKIKEKINFFNWILEIAACEIEEILEPAFKENALINFMTAYIHARLKVYPSNQLDNETTLVQTYVAVHRALYSLDAPLISYNLIKYFYPRWFEDDRDYLDHFAQNIRSVKQKVEEALSLKSGKEFFKICERHDAPFLLLGDVMKEIENDPEGFEAKLADHSVLSPLIETVYEKRLSTLKKRLYRSAVYSTLSIFVAGIASFFLFEGPIAELAGYSFSWFALFIDLAVPSALMFLLVVTIRLPQKDNLKRIQDEITKIVSKLNETEVYEVYLIKRKNLIIQAIFSIFSMIGGVVGAYAVYMVFKVAGVPWTSIYIDTVNVAMVVFAAMVIRHKALELTVQEGGGVLTMLLDYFYLPLARLGQWFSQKWKEYNIVSVFFSALIDSPFSMIMGLIEDWRAYLRDRRSEIH